MNITDEQWDKEVNKFSKKLKGYAYFYRERYSLLLKKILTDEEFILYTFISDVLVDWDHRHSATYGMFELDFEIQTELMGISLSKLRKNTRALLSKHFIVHHYRRQYSLVGFELIHVRARGFNYLDSLLEEVKKVEDGSQNS